MAKSEKSQGRVVAPVAKTETWRDWLEDARRLHAEAVDKVYDRVILLEKVSLEQEFRQENKLYSDKDVAEYFRPLLSETALQFDQLLALMNFTKRDRARWAHGIAAIWAELRAHEQQQRQDAKAKKDAAETVPGQAPQQTINSRQRVCQLEEERDKLLSEIQNLKDKNAFLEKQVETLTNALARRSDARPAPRRKAARA